MKHAFALAALVALLGCGRRPAPTPLMAGISDPSEAEISATIAQALAADAAGRSADTLYAPGAVIVLNGRTRSVPPVFAGVGTGGQIAVSSSQLEIGRGLAWSLVEYRWSSQEGITREGRATLVLKPGPDGHWRIQHVHSSSPR